MIRGRVWWLVMALATLPARGQTPPTPSPRPFVPPDPSVYVRPEDMIVIDGRLEPEKIPNCGTWEDAFILLSSMFEGRTNIQDPEVNGIVRANLYMDDSDGAVLLQRVVHAKQRIDVAQARLESKDVAVQEVLDQRWREWSLVVKEESDALLASLSPQGVKGLRRWLQRLREGTRVRFTLQDPIPAWEAICAP